MENSDLFLQMVVEFFSFNVRKFRNPHIPALADSSWNAGSFVFYQKKSSSLKQASQGHVLKGF